MPLVELIDITPLRSDPFQMLLKESFEVSKTVKAKSRSNAHDGGWGNGALTGNRRYRAEGYNVRARKGGSRDAFLLLGQCDGSFGNHAFEVGYIIWPLENFLCFHKRRSVEVR
jgi:hypothetical protein